MTRRLLLAYLSITALTLVMVVVPLGLVFSSRERDRLVFGLERDAHAISAVVEDDLEAGATPDLSSAFAAFDVHGGRIIVTDDQGISVADSERNDLGRDYSSRPEVARALEGQLEAGTRHSETLDENLVYVAIPVASGGEVHGVVRITIPTSTVDERVQDTWMRLGGLCIVVLGVVSVVGLLLARSVTRPVQQIEAAARDLADGDLTARVGKVHGPPELADLAEQFDTTAARLEHLVEAQRRFVSDASHQLRTPLTALRLRLETLQPGPVDAPKVAAALAETDRLSRLVQSLLAIARSEAATPELADVDLAAIAAARCEAWTAAAEAEGVVIVLRGPDALLVRAVDGGIEQILDNLIENAIAVAPDGSTLTIDLSTRLEGGGRLAVTDEGPGMTDEERSQATSRFWRAPGSEAPGSGLGLAIVDHLVLSGGGDLTLEPGDRGRGLRVVVDFAAPAGPPRS